MWLKLSNVHKVSAKRADGSTFYYFYAWRGGPRLCHENGKPLVENDSPDSFVDALERARQDQKRPARNTISWLIEKFKESQDWEDLKPRTRKDHLKHFKVIKEEFGTSSLLKAEAQGSRGAFKNWRASMAHAPKVADNHWSSLLRLFTFAVDQEYMSRNPCANAGKLYKGNRADKWWSPSEIQRFRALASPQIDLAMLIAISTGQRQGDILSLLWSQYNGTHLTVHQSKTGKIVKVLCAPDLKTTIDKLPRRSTHILISEDKKPWSQSGFSASWRRTTKRAGIVDRTFHDLRGTFVMMALRNKQKIEDIALITGHSLSDLRTLEKHYMGWDQAAADDVILAFNQNKI